MIAGVLSLFGGGIEYLEVCPSIPLRVIGSYLLPSEAQNARSHAILSGAKSTPPKWINFHRLMMPDSSAEYLTMRNSGSARQYKGNPRWRIYALGIDSGSHIRV